MSYMFEILPSLLNGASMTLQVFALVLIFSIPLGIVVAFALQVRWKPLHYLIDLYIWVMRGTPLLLQLIFIYYVLPSIGIRLDRLPAAVIAFVLNYAAYFAEIFRGGIETIPKGQYEAAKDVNRVQLVLYFAIGKYLSQHTRNRSWREGALVVISDMYGNATISSLWE